MTPLIVDITWAYRLGFKQGSIILKHGTENETEWKKERLLTN
jgi:hypothetical protein